MDRVDELSQFAALYSDRVFIHNFLSRWASHPEKRTEHIGEARRGFERDLKVLLKLRPLVDAGRVEVVTPPDVWCPHCFGQRMEALDGFDDQMMAGLANAGERLDKRFLREGTFTIKRRGSGYAVEIHTPEDLLSHGFHGLDFDDLSGLKELPAVRARMARGTPIRLTPDEVERLGAHRGETAEIMQNVLFELVTSQIFKTSFLSERPIHVDILQSLTTDSLQEKRNAVLKKHLTTFVPFLTGVPAEELLKIRGDNEPSFVLFRRALNSAIDESLKAGSDLDERRARQVYGDVIEPSLARVDLKLKNAEKTVRRSAGRKLAAWVGAISFGVVSGVVPSGLQAAAKILGLSKVLADLGEAAMKNGADEAEIGNEEMYFLWKVRQSHSRRIR